MEPSTNQSRKGKQMKVGTNDEVAVNGGHTEQSYRTTCPNRKPSELNSLLVECQSSCCLVVDNKMVLMQRVKLYRWQIQILLEQIQG